MGKRTPLGPYRRPMPRVIGGWAFSDGRGSPVHKVFRQLGPAFCGTLGQLQGYLAHEKLPPLRTLR